MYLFSGALYRWTAPRFSPILGPGTSFGRHRLETLSAHVPSSMVLYGSDFPWFDPASNLTRVLLAGIEEEYIQKILRDNAIEVYGIRD